jgi:hypothetical protein
MYLYGMNVSGCDTPLLYENKTCGIKLITFNYQVHFKQN